VRQLRKLTALVQHLPAVISLAATEARSTCKCEITKRRWRRVCQHQAEQGGAAGRYGHPARLGHGHCPRPGWHTGNEQCPRCPSAAPAGTSLIPLPGPASCPCHRQSSSTTSSPTPSGRN